MGYRTPCLLAALLLAVGCGGNVVEQGGSGGSSSGGSSSGGSPNGGSPNGGSSNGGAGGAPVSCSGFTDCCVQACTQLVDSIQCPNTPNPDCGCNASNNLSAACTNAMTDAYRCLLKTGPQAVKCDQNGNLALRCGVCESQLQALTQACNGIQPKCVY
jgi:hypothetical protein